MVGPLSQSISLISYGNEYIVTGKHRPGYYPQDPVFRYCHAITFEGYSKSFFSSKKINAGNNPLEWFGFLKQSDCRELRLLHQPSKQNAEFPDYKTAGMIGGGGSWLIEAVYKKTSDFWYAHWETQETHPEQPWKIKYEVAARDEPPVNPQLIFYHAKENLLRSLHAMHDFTDGKQELAPWDHVFQKAIIALDSENPAADFYHPGLIITGNYSLAAQQLIFGAAKSWIFGGMGSWNDQGFDEKKDQEVYEKITETLYMAVIHALIAGINSY